MILSEKASAFFIENLISNSEKKPKINNINQNSSSSSLSAANESNLNNHAPRCGKSRDEHLLNHANIYSSLLSSLSSSSSSSSSSNSSFNFNEYNSVKISNSPEHDCVSPVSSKFYFKPILKLIFLVFKSILPILSTR
jgi:hypothetical protein